MHRKFRKHLSAGCDVPGPGDGIDPRLDSREQPHQVKNRKALQLCSQVAETLTLVLAGECDDDLLRDLLVEAVTPFPTSARLLVTLRPTVSAAAATPVEVAGRLEGVRARLRAEVAQAIHRRKAPDLVFRVLPASH